MKEIKLSKGYIVLINDKDFEKVNQYKWRFIGTGYAGAWDKKTNKIIRMHRLIIDVPQGMIVDHKNGNGLDNRRKNLRACTYAQNSANKKKSSKNTTGYKGVYYYKNHKLPFYAKISISNKLINIGAFSTARKAARAYDVKAKEIWGKFARPNISE